MRDQCRWFGGMVGNHVADIVASYGDTGEVPQALTDYINGPRGLRLQRALARSATSIPRSYRTRSWTASACWARLMITSPSSSSSSDIGVDQFAGYLQHDNKEETLRVYGESVMPILRTHVTAKS